MAKKKQFEFLYQEADALVSGKVKASDKRLRRRAVSAKGIPQGLWKRFGMLAKEKEQNVPDALVEALVLWIQKNGR